MDTRKYNWSDWYDKENDRLKDGAPVELQRVFNYGSRAILFATDIVLCIDASEGMDHIFNMLQKNAVNLCWDILVTMRQRHKLVKNPRIKIIIFRDYLADGSQAMMMSDFFELPKQTDDFLNCINSIKAEGGGDGSNNGFEAIAYAIRSNWIGEGYSRYRHIIVILTDQDAHELGFGNKSRFYPKGMAKDFGDLTKWWGSRLQSGFMNENAKRMVLFAPDTPNWTSLLDTWNNIIQFKTELGGGLKDYDYYDVLEAITNTI